MIDYTTPPTGILVGVDGSITTLAAVDWAAREAARRELSLDLVQVLPSPVAPCGDVHAPSGRAHVLLDRARRTATRAAPQVPVRLLAVEGSTGPALVATAAHARLLVLGARPGIGVADTSVGRTATHAMGHAACPVVVVPDREQPAAPAGTRVLVGFDGSAEALGALAYAADVAESRAGSLTVLTVIPTSDASSTATEERHLAEASAGVAARHPGLAVRDVVRRGNPAGELLGQARADTSLVVLGSRGRGAFAGVLLGSTGQEVIRMAPCPVAVLPPTAAAVWAHPERTGVREGTT